MITQIHFKWNNMCCNTCDRYSTDEMCDLLGKHDKNDYCKLFIPSIQLSKENIINMIYLHNRRFIIENQE